MQEIVETTLQQKQVLDKLTEEELTYVNGILAFYRIGGIPADEALSYGQKIIFFSIVSKNFNRVEIVSCTQYGKSLVVALACLYLSCVLGELVAVIAPNQEKAKIIMRYFIDHLGDHYIFKRRLEKNTKLERLKQEETHNRIILNNAGGIFVVSAQEKNSIKSFESAMGLGAKNTILDEACLISDRTEATIFRMIAGQGEDAFYCKIGNPFYSEAPYSHFKHSWDDSKYTKVFIDYEQALKEGRYTQDYIDEAVNKPLWDVLGRCIFPDEDIIDKDGWRKLILNSIIEKKYKVLPLEERIGEPKLGIDVGAGGDLTTFVLRWDNYTKVETVSTTSDTMLNIPIVEDIVAKYSLKWYNVSIDDIGIGRGLRDRLREKGYGVNGVGVGEKCKLEKDKKIFFNIKAQISWEAKKWLDKEDVFIEPFNYKGVNVWEQITWTRYRENSERTMQIEDKENLKRRHNGKSPDFADGFFLTFYKRFSAGIIPV